MSVLAAQDVRLHLSGRAVLSGLSARFLPGKVTVILGPNGVGKSSLLACLAGLRSADSGNVTLGDVPIAQMDRQERARAIGLLPQKTQVHWDIEVRALVALGRLPHANGWGLSVADEAAIDAALAATDTAGFAHRPVQQLSGGEQGRVMLARVLAGQPRWLLADEPLASLDPAHQIDVLDRLAQTAREGAGVVVVLHDLTQAARIADDVLLMRGGEVLALGGVEEVLTEPLMRQAYGVSVHIAFDSEGRRIVVPVGRAQAPQ
jgi:iron complex transport system ATP-binding protein